MALADRTGFQAKTIQVIDGSKRSSHSNAYFTGFGRFRRIVLFDTLMEQLGPKEIEAVLAHEIGHYRKGHIPRMIAMSALSLAAGFWVLQWFSGQDWFIAGFGFSRSPEVYGELARYVPVFLLFVILGGLVTFWVSPLFNWLSRKHEFEADRFARDAMGSSRYLISALRAMYKKNLGNLIPHPSYSRFYYSHPTLREREKSLKEGETSGTDEGDPELIPAEPA
jgi:STE24 endopeptidase